MALNSRYTVALVVTLMSAIFGLLQWQQMLHVQMYHGESTIIHYQQKSSSSSSSLSVVESLFSSSLSKTASAAEYNGVHRKTVHMVTAADGAFTERYQPIFDKMQEYADRHDYSWTILNNGYFEEKGGTPTECMVYKTFFFLKHCMIAAWMEWEGFPETDSIYVFDADVAPYRMNVSLDHWTQMNETLVLYVRGWSPEIMAGNYLIRNSIAGRNYLRSWAQYEQHKPRGFSSADNGALHILLLRQLGLEKWDPLGKCGQEYKNLVAPVTNMDPYWHYVNCCREHLTEGTHSKGNFSVRLLAQRKGFAIDHVIDSDNMPETPPFHHGIKFEQFGVIQPSFVPKYNLTLPTLPPGKPLDKPPGVPFSCGQHQAPTCGECPAGSGANWCNGDCRWCPYGSTLGPAAKFDEKNETIQCVMVNHTCRKGEES